MKTYFCIDKIKNAKGEITYYKLVDENHNVIPLVEAQELKKMLRNNKIKINNLTLTKDNRLVTKSINIMDQILNSDKISEFTKRCLFDSWSKHYNIVLEHTKNSINVQDFCNKILNDERLYFTQGYSELSKQLNGHPERTQKLLRTLPNVIELECYADAGSVKIGNDTASFNIPNKYGDDATKVFVLEKVQDDIRNFDMLNFFTSIAGELNVYEYDCGNKVALKLPKGRYAIYNAPKTVFIQRWPN